MGVFVGDDGVVALSACDRSKPVAFNNCGCEADSSVFVSAWPHESEWDGYGDMCICMSV
jgi:hypothetical protein